MTQPATGADAPELIGLLAKFDGPESLRAAAAGMREAGYTRFDAYSPFPVHGLDGAMGRRRTRLPWLVLGGAVAGGLIALWLQWWTNAVDYPFLSSGKPLWSLPANVPIIFEGVILLGALAAFGGCLLLSGLPEWFYPQQQSATFRRVTTGGFCLGVDAADPQFDAAATAALLRSLGARTTEMLHRPETRRKLPGVLAGGVAVLLALALLPPAWIAVVRYAPKSKPRIHPIQDMDFQPKYLPQQAVPTWWFADGRAMRPPVPGTVAADAVFDDHLLRGKVDGQAATTFPMPVTDELMRRGQERFDIYCATCHGLAGEGDGITSQLAFERAEPKWIRPTSLHDPPVRGQPVGQLFETISNGIRTMPSYRSQIAAEDRWAIILYVRALQRSRDATMDDVDPRHRGALEAKLKQ